MIPLSIVIITYNEEMNLARCLASVQAVADEILVVDSSSTDGTAAIARQYDARVILHPFIGYGEQKNFATEQASHNWILSLDADEELTDKLRSHILQLKANGLDAYNVYRTARLTNYCGKWIRHSGWYPDWQTRLYDRTKGRWKEQKVHEYWQATDNSDAKGVLKGDLLHYSFSSISDHVKKTERYTELAAQAAAENGKTASLLKIWGSPKWHFFSEYFIKLGFLDGFYGYVICRLSAYAAFIKYSKIRAYSKSKSNRIKKRPF
jgi:glycosyltransferase involved in cell wall biosynthesis